MDGGNIDEVKQLLVKLAVIAEQLDTRSRGALQRIDASVASLDRSTRHWTEGGEDFSRKLMEMLGTQARDGIATTARQALAPLDAQLHRSAEAAKWAADALAEQRKLLTAAQRALVRRSLRALLLGSLLAACGSGYLAWHGLRGAAWSDDLRRAVGSGELVRCPDSQALCARIGPNPRRAGRHGEYLVLQP